MPSAGNSSLPGLLIRTRRRPVRTVVSEAGTWETVARTAAGPALARHVTICSIHARVTNPAIGVRPPAQRNGGLGRTGGPRRLELRRRPAAAGGRAARGARRRPAHRAAADARHV